MSDKKPYSWKVFQGKEFIIEEISDDHVECEMPRTTSFVYQQDRYSQEFNSVKMPQMNYRILFKLLEGIGLDQEISKFITIGCCLQSNYSTYYFWANQELFKEADRYNEEKDNLLKVIEEYLRYPNMDNVHSISFKFNKQTTVSIKNKFVLLELFDAISKGYGLTWQNFSEINDPSKKNKLLATKSHEKLKTEFIQSFYNFIYPSYNNDSNTLKFIGAFMYIFNVPINRDESEIEHYLDIDDLLKSINIKSLKHYMIRPPKTSS